MYNCIHILLNYRKHRARDNILEFRVKAYFKKTKLQIKMIIFGISFVHPDLRQPKNTHVTWEPSDMKKYSSEYLVQAVYMYIPL